MMWNRKLYENLGKKILGKKNKFKGGDVETVGQCGLWKESTIEDEDR